MRLRPVLLAAAVLLVVAGWVCTAVGVRDVVGTGPGVDPMVLASSGITSLGIAGDCLMAFGLVLLAATAITSRRFTEVGLGLLLTIRLILLAADWLHSRRFSADLPRHFTQFFNDHVPIIRLTSVLVVVLTVSLALQIRGRAGQVVFWTVVVACVGYATASFFGPPHWPLGAGGFSDSRQLVDAAGYARLLIAEVLLDGLLLAAVFRIERPAPLSIVGP